MKIQARASHVSLMNRNIIHQRWRRFLCLVVLIAGIALSLPIKANENTPIHIVEAFHVTLLTTMQSAKALGYKGRYGKLAPVIERRFHLPLMVQVATGSYWKKATEKQRDLLVGAFSKISIGTYASRFTGYSGQTFVTLGRRDGPQQTILVKTKIANPSGKDVELTYVTRLIKGTWRIIDVLLDTGISELAVRRSEYRRILKSKGIDGLISTLDGKAAALRKAATG